MAQIADVDAVELMRDVTMYVRIKRLRELRFRNWLGTRLIGLAALIMNCRIEVEDL